MKSCQRFFFGQKNIILMDYRMIATYLNLLCITFKQYVSIIFIGNLTMFITKHIQSTNKPSSKHHYFQSQFMDCTPQRPSCRNVSTSLCSKNQNQDYSNIKQTHKPIPAKEKEHKRTLSLREQINLKLQKEKNKKKQASSIPIIDDRSQPISNIRKMLTEDTPPRQKDKKSQALINKQNLQAIRRQNRAQFQLRQQQMITLRQKKQEIARTQKLKKDSQECTFKPKLTTYRPL